LRKKRDCLATTWNRKPVGLAQSDTTRTIAMPMQTLKRGKLAADAEVLEKIAVEWGGGGLVIGLPEPAGRSLEDIANLPDQKRKRKSGRMP
jgi:RNase H-fold protein (predicted Holliday junction resolvase)